MERKEYAQIRQWLYNYSDFELQLKQHYRNYNDFLFADDATINRDTAGWKDKLTKFFSDTFTSPGLPSFGLFEIDPNNKFSAKEYQYSGELTGELFINPSYDLGFSMHPRYCKSPKHTHDYYELEYVLEGRAHQVIWAGASKKNFTLLEGGFLLIPPSVSHEVYVNDESILLNLMIRKDACETALLQNLPEGSELVDFFRRALYSENPLYLVLQTDNALELQECFFDLLIENYGNGHYRRELANLKTSVFFLNLLSRTGLSIDYYNKDMKDTDYVPAIISFMEKNYRTVTVQEIADAFGFSRAHLGRIYKRHTGSTLYESICAIRMRQATMLLLQSEYSIQQISQMVGYEDTTNFIRRFRGNYQITPYQYRLNQLCALK